MTDFELTEPEGEWDGAPRIRLSVGEATYLIENFVPHFCIQAVGPKIPFTGRHANISVSCFVRADRETAETDVAEHIRVACAHEGVVYDADEWKITTFQLVNGN